MITSTPVLQNLTLEMNTSWETWFIYRSPYQDPREGYKISMSQCNRYGNKTRLPMILYIRKNNFRFLNNGCQFHSRDHFFIVLHQEKSSCLSRARSKAVVYLRRNAITRNQMEKTRWSIALGEIDVRQLWENFSYQTC